MPGDHRFRSRLPIRHLVLLVTIVVVATLTSPASSSSAADRWSARPARASVPPRPAPTHVAPADQAPPQPGQPLAAGQSVPVDGFGARVAPELAGVPVHSADLDTREDALGEARNGLTAAEDEKGEVQDLLRNLAADRQDALEAVTDAEAALTEATDRKVEAEAELERREADRTDAEERRDDARDAIRVLAVVAYMDPQDALAWLSDDPDEVLAAGKERVLSQSVGDDRLRDLAERTDELVAAEDAVQAGKDEVKAAAGRVDERTDELNGRRAAVGDLDRRIGETQERDRAADEQLFQASADVNAAEGSVADGRVLSSVDAVDFPLVALDAYWKAAHAAPCPIEWWALAGITKVESGHGTYRGASLDARGVASPAIVGIPLNGTNGTAVIRDTDGGRLDYDAVYDRAVGPMQFIPSTWAGSARDGNGDGVSSPHDLYDVALGAAGYLCKATPDLTTEAGLRRGFYSYNHSDAYVSKVLGYAYDYRSALSI